MIAKLLIHPTLEARLEAINQTLAKSKLKKGHPDVLWLEDQEKLGVETAKKIREHLSLKPYSAQNRAVVVESAPNFTTDAQNSLLKTLEEPPDTAIILLSAESEKNFLPTVLSRVETVILDQTTDKKVDNNRSWTVDIEKLLQSSAEQRFEYVEGLEDKEQFLAALTQFFQKRLQQDPLALDFTRKLIKAEEWKQANGNTRAILEYLMLMMSGLD